MARLPQSMPSDTHKSLEEVRDHCRTGLIPQLLEIQKHRIMEQKSLRSIQCLCRKQDTNSVGSTKTLRRTLISDYQFEKTYVAVSYPWEQPENEDPAVGVYRIESGDGGTCTLSKVRDVVLTRAIAYAARYDVDLIWIDKECINQDDAHEKEIAMQSMDLVYSFSNFPLGLHSTQIELAKQLDLLIRLLRRKFVKISHRRQYRTLAPRIDVETASRVVELLQHITSDPWWDRAWIYQEEYRSSVKMRLLIPHAPSLRKEHAEKELGDMPNELQIVSARFHSVTTEFCLAYLSEAEKQRLDDANKCRTILTKAGKYNILHRYSQKDADGKIRKAMSPTIFTDIGHRKITVPSDVLAIAANCCDYSVRLSTKSLNTTDYSLSLCILALYLLNGEIIQNGRGDNKSLSSNVFQYLDENSLDDFEPPVSKKELTFMKSCRFVDVELSPHGILTTGWLWKRREALNTTGSTFRKRMGSGPKSSSLGLSDYSRSVLQRLASSLQQKHQALVQDIERYLEEDASSDNHENIASKRYKDAMAEQVVEAIRQGRPLYLGCPLGSQSYRGIFIGEHRQDELPKASYVFTAYNLAGQSSGNVFSARSIDKIVSLDVDVVGYRQGLPRLRTKKWINGLCFFEQSSVRKVVFPWPFD